MHKKCKFKSEQINLKNGDDLNITTTLSKSANLKRNGGTPPKPLRF
jgi:hypothetical protein